MKKIRKVSYDIGRSSAAVAAWSRPGGIHKDQKKDNRQDRRRVKRELKNLGTEG